MTGELNWRTDVPPLWSKEAAADYDDLNQKTKEKIGALIKSIYIDGLLGGGLASQKNCHIGQNTQEE